MNIKTRYAYSWIIVILIPYGLTAHGARSGGLATRQVGALHIEQFGAYNALAEISRKAGLPVGVDAVQPISEPTVVFDFPGGSAADLLNTFVSQVPDYSWHEKQGIIHVERNNGHVSLLDVVISYPTLRTTREAVWLDIGKRPEVSSWLSANHCSRNELRNGREFRDHNESILVEGGEITFGQLLDQVAIKSGANYWAVLQSPANKPCRVDVLMW
jgi:hypothetical protein